MLLTQRAPSMIATSNNNASNTTHGMPPIEVLRQTLLQALAKIDHCFGKGVTPVRSHKGYKWRRKRSTDDDGSIAINCCNSNSKLSGYIRAIDSLKSLKSLEIYRNPKKLTMISQAKAFVVHVGVVFPPRSFHWNWKFFCSIPKKTSREVSWPTSDSSMVGRQTTTRIMLRLLTYGALPAAQLCNQTFIANLNCAYDYCISITNC